MEFFLNPKRETMRTWSQRIKFWAQFPFIRFGLWLGFPNVDYSHFSGYRDRIRIGKGCSTMNTLFNTNSGTITVGDDTIFGSNCMVITGQHRFHKGRRARLQPDAPFGEVPENGNDIKIGSGCFICSSVVIIKGVTIGDNVIIGAGSVVTRDIPGDCFAAGNPARVVKFFKDDKTV